MTFIFLIRTPIFCYLQQLLPHNPRWCGWQTLKVKQQGATSIVDHMRKEKWYFKLKPKGGVNQLIHQSIPAAILHSCF